MQTDPLNSNAKKPYKDYVEFCQAGAHDKEEKLDILEPEERLYPKELQLEGSLSDSNILIDVRPECEFDIVNLQSEFKEKLHNIPLKKLKRNSSPLLDLINDESKSVTFLCRRGNDSQLAVRDFRDVIKQKSPNVIIRDLRDGLYGWHESVDPTLPLYWSLTWLTPYGRSLTPKQFVYV